MEEPSRASPVPHLGSIRRQRQNVRQSAQRIAILPEKSTKTAVLAGICGEMAVWVPTLFGPRAQRLNDSYAAKQRVLWSWRQVNFLMKYGNRGLD